LTLGGPRRLDADELHAAEQRVGSQPGP
jgi:hypothetical protein